MTTTTPYFGRLGNQIIRNIAVSFIAERFDLHVSYSNAPSFEALGIPLFCGTKKYEKTEPLTDKNYFSVYHAEKVEYNLDSSHDCFQMTTLIPMVHTYLQNVQSSVMEKNPYKERYQNNQDAFVHIRLGDVQKYNPGLLYYVNAIQTLSVERLYLATDEPTHEIVTELCKRYPHIVLIEGNEVNTIQFASTCRHIVLSHGSFSSVIGYLSFFSDIYYPEHTSGKIWYGDLCCIPGWKKCSVK